jgi:branched-chain amino acid aminotransferase
MVFYVNGEWYPRSEAKISVLDLGLAYGDGAFEGIRVYRGKIFKLDQHLDRLFRSIRVISIESPVTKDELMRLAIDFVRRSNLVDGHFKILVTRGQGYVSIGKSESKASLLIFGMPIEGLYQESSRKGIRLKTSALRKPPPECLDARIKTLNYMSSILARLDAYASGADDSLMLDVHGFVAEGPTINFFIVKDGVIRTPSKYHALEGITRSTVIELARSAGYTVSEENITLYDVYTADEAFVCGTAAEVVPVIEVDGRRMRGVGPATKRLQELYHELTHEDGPWLTKAL